MLILKALSDLAILELWSRDIACESFFFASVEEVMDES